MEKPYVVGMDIGGTNTVFGVVDSRGNVLASDSVKKKFYRAFSCSLVMGMDQIVIGFQLIPCRHNKCIHQLHCYPYCGKFLLHNAFLQCQQEL